MADLLITAVVVCAVALLVLWVVERFLPEFAYPARIVIGVCVLILLILLVAKLVPTLRVG